jgi:glutaredoxin
MKIIIYTSDHCASCRDAIRFFEEKDLPFRQLDVGKNKENFNEMLRQGGIATPFIIVGTRKFHSFDRDKMEEVLKDDHG